MFGINGRKTVKMAELSTAQAEYNNIAQMNKNNEKFDNNIAKINETMDKKQWKN